MGGAEKGAGPTREGMGAGPGAEWTGAARGRAPRVEPLARRVGTPAHRASSRSCLWYSSARAYSFR